MLPLLTLTALNAAIPTAQASTTAQLCQSNPTQSNTPGAYTVFFDNDPNFVYGGPNCTNTNQKFVDPNWYSLACGAAIEAACGTTSSDDSGITGEWTFSWHQHTGAAGGATCQAALYQSLGIGNSGAAGYLMPECCRRTFQAAVQMLSTTYQPSPDIETPNRASVNIAPGGFPYTKGIVDQAFQCDADGMQVDAGLPSHVLQA